jgi:hypothetical protein
MEQLCIQQPGYAPPMEPTATGANPGPCSVGVDGPDMNMQQNPGLRPVLGVGGHTDGVNMHENPGLCPVLAAGGQADSHVPKLLPCCWGCRVVAGPTWDFGDQDGKEGNVGTVKRPSKKVILAWIDEWADGGNESGWSPYKSVAVNWGKKGETYYYKLADHGQYDVKPAPDCGADHVCGGGKTKFWEVANMWDTLLEQKMRSMQLAIENIDGITWHQRRVLRRSLQENYDAALAEKATFCKLRNEIHGELESDEAAKKPAATVHKKPAATVHKKPAATVHKKPAATVSKRPACKPAVVCKKPSARR